jgi:acyl-CoA thioester hydrolase
MKADPRRRERAAYPHHHILETRFADMDVNFHLNNVAIARLFEEVRVRFNRAGPVHEAAGDARSRYVVARVAIDYLSEGNYPAPVWIGYAVTHIGNSSFTIAMAAFQDDACIALCDSVLVHRLPGSGPAPMPQALRERLEAHALRG